MKIHHSFIIVEIADCSRMTFEEALDEFFKCPVMWWGFKSQEKREVTKGIC